MVTHRGNPVAAERAALRGNTTTLVSLVRFDPSSSGAQRPFAASQTPVHRLGWCSRQSLASVRTFRRISGIELRLAPAHCQGLEQDNDTLAWALRSRELYICSVVMSIATMKLWGGVFRKLAKETVSNPGPHRNRSQDNCVKGSHLEPFIVCQPGITSVMPEGCHLAQDGVVSTPSEMARTLSTRRRSISTTSNRQPQK